MQQDPVKLAIIVGSNREGRFGGIVGEWFRAFASSRPDVDVDYIDLAAIDLPTVIPQVSDPATLEYIRRIDAADAFVVVTPEYNHGYPASLKQAIDLARDEWTAKPVAFVSYGGMAGGLRAVEQLRPVFAELHATTIRDTVSFHFAIRAFDEDGRPRDTRGPVLAANRMLEQLTWWARALRDARAARPFVAA